MKEVSQRVYEGFMRDMGEDCPQLTPTKDPGFDGWRQLEIESLVKFPVPRGLYPKPGASIYAKTNAGRNK
jgi:hypothetical protein